jgi:ankyrin repeat protein
MAQGITPFHIAVNNNKPGTVERLLHKGADFKVKNKVRAGCHASAAAPTFS